MINHVKQITSSNNSGQKYPLHQRPWFPWLISALATLIYGIYLFTKEHFIFVNDLAMFVWMAGEEISGGLGSSTNLLKPAGYPILLNIFNFFGLSYLNSSRLLSLFASFFILSMTWIAAAKAAKSTVAGIIAWLAMITSYHFLINAATTLPEPISFALILPIIILSFSNKRNFTTIIGVSILAGLACNVRYTYFQSVLPLSLLLFLFAHPASWKQRRQELLALIAGVLIGLSPEIIFALRLNHIPFQTPAKYYLTLITGEADFSMQLTQFQNMPSTLTYIFQNFLIISISWIKQYIHLMAVFVLPIGVIWIIAEWLIKQFNTEAFPNFLRRHLFALLLFQALLLIPFSLRQPLPPYVIPVLLCFTFIASSLPVSIMLKKFKIFKILFICCLSILSIFQLQLLINSLQQGKKFWVYNTTIAKELKGLGIKNSASVLNGPFPLALVWPYGDISPMIYYTLQEPAGLAMMNTFKQKRPFLYAPTTKDIKKFRAVLTDSLIQLPGFHMAKRVNSLDLPTIFIYYNEDD